VSKDISKILHTFSFLKDQKIFLACSGGVDSIVLLDILSQLTNKIIVLHVNYQLRGKDSDADEKLVRAIGLKYNFPVHVKKTDTKKILEKGGNLQEVTRTIRTSFFNSYLQTDVSAYLALGHHMDDQIETFMQHLARKSGILGMSCMLEIHKNVVRPLLAWSKEEVYAYAKENKLLWREDITNKQSKYTRNKLRNIIIPSIETEVPSFRNSVIELVMAFQQTQKEIESKLHEIVSEFEQTNILKFKTFDSLSEEEKWEVLRCKECSSYLKEIKKIRSSQKGKKIETEHYIVYNEGDSFFFKEIKKEIERVLLIEKQDILPNIFNKEEIWLDKDKVKGELVLRKWKIGEYIRPVGMKGKKLVSDVINDAKIPSHAKKKVYVVCDAEEIHWVVGCCIGRGALVDNETINMLKVSTKNI
jgi:tRNA(Ile)-lysidine synthase